MADLWLHQQFAIEAVPQAFAAGHRRVCLTSPTGGGKSRMVTELVTRWLGEGKRVSVYTNRKLLIDQLGRVMGAAGLEYGVRAAGHQDERHLPLQISSIQTEVSRVLKREGRPGALGAWEVHPADVVVVDEAHLFNGDSAWELLGRHLDAGAVLLGVTATPLGLGGRYEHLVLAGKPSELRACGALVLAHHFAPDEPDLKHVGRFSLGEDPTEKQNVKAIMVPGVYGRVADWYRRLNPLGRPALLFAPGVKESVFFAEELSKVGIRSAHIDGEDVWLDGEFVASDRRSRDEVLRLHAAGGVKVVCNRFVLREGVDLPHVEHLILATVIGSLTSYLQVAGRGLRASPATGKEQVVIQDHGGNWHRHGSVNADREWDLDMTPAMAAALYRDQWREPRPGEKPPPQPCACPQCGRVLAGVKCPCGFTVAPDRRSRVVIQADGTPKEMKGEVHVPVRRVFKEKTMELWERMYYRAKNSKNRMTFAQAEALFALEHYYHPPKTLPLMPAEWPDWHRPVCEVPPERLNQHGR